VKKKPQDSQVVIIKRVSHPSPSAHFNRFSCINFKITSTKEEAKEELLGLLEILQEEEANPKEMQATFEELARTESDCSSAKRGGDLGFFGRRKMQPPFEHASFALEIGEMTKEVVETSSGVHLILRIG
jgi:NIMA-interacting peptidyl-prolyl cis-trans isomerase 1